MDRRLKDLILDTWAHFTFKQEFDTGYADRDSWRPPTWVGDHHRRLSAYKMLQAYKANAARYYLSIDSDADRARRDERHEYGDVDVLVQSITSALLGSDIRIGAPDDAEAPPVYVEWAQNWGEKVRAVRKLTAAEDHAVGEGDGVLVVGWDALNRRPSLMPYDPGYYFPVLDDMTEEYPRKVHLAWEIAPRIDDEDIVKVRRITYELRPLERPVLLPWNSEPSEWGCFKSDGVWTLDGKATVEDFEPGQATWELNPDGTEIRDLFIGTDFIPVVHIPNTIADEEHFGVSSLAPVLQLLDEIAAADTDLAKGAAIAGFPPLAAEQGIETSADGTLASYGPGTVFTGKLTSIDTSAGLRSLMDYVLFLLKRLNTNSRIPEVLLGRVDPSNIPSGTALRLMFSQMSMMIDRMRLVRDEKYPLVFKMAARFAMANGELDATDDWPPISFLPGSFIPADEQEIVGTVVAMYEKKLISLETAISILIEAGVPIDNVEDEIRRIQQRDYAAAQMAGLVDENLARELVGRPPVSRQRPEAPPGVTGLPAESG